MLKISFILVKFEMAYKQTTKLMHATNVLLILVTVNILIQESMQYFSNQFDVLHSLIGLVFGTVPTLWYFYFSFHSIHSFLFSVACMSGFSFCVLYTVLSVDTKGVNRRWSATQWLIKREKKTNNDRSNTTQKTLD
jgi:branched-subunit amino acid ABC-type transport system permease component